MGLTLGILQTPFINQFDNPLYSHEDFKQFGVELRGALNTNIALSGVSAAQQAAYNDALDLYLSHTGGTKSAVMYQKGSTAAENAAWDMAVAEVRRKEGLVKSKFDKGSPQYLQFFGLGLAPFIGTKKGDRLDLLDNLIDRFTDFAADFPGAAATMTATKHAYLDSAGTQTDAKGSTKGGRTQRDLSRLALSNNMHEIWLTIAMANRGKPEVVNVFLIRGFLIKAPTTITTGWAKS